MEKKNIVIIIISIIVIISIISGILYWDFTRIIEKPLDLPKNETVLEDLSENTNLLGNYSESIPQGYTINKTDNSVVVTLYLNKSLIKTVTTYKFENDECTEILTEAHYESKATAASMNKDTVENYKRKGNVIYSNKINNEVTETKEQLFERLKNQYDKITIRIN